VTDHGKLKIASNLIIMTNALETLDAVRESAMDFLQELGRHIANTLSCFSCSVAMQHGMPPVSLALHCHPLVWTMKSLYYYNYISTFYDWTLIILYEVQELCYGL